MSEPESESEFQPVIGIPYGPSWVRAPIIPSTPTTAPAQSPTPSPAPSTIPESVVPSPTLATPQTPDRQPCLDLLRSVPLDKLGSLLTDFFRGIRLQFEGQGQLIQNAGSQQTVGAVYSYLSGPWATAYPEGWKALCDALRARAGSMAIVPWTEQPLAQRLWHLPRWVLWGSVGLIVVGGSVALTVHLSKDQREE
jgi:hypothetical protein